MSVEGTGLSVATRASGRASGDDPAAARLPRPAFLEDTLRNYMLLRGYLRQSGLYSASLRPRFDFGGNGDLVTAYLATDERRPLAVVLEADIRRIYADRRFKILTSTTPGRVRGRGLRELAAAAGIAILRLVARGKRGALRASRPALKTLLVSRSVDSKAQELNRAFLKLLARQEAATPAALAGIADFVRMARFAESNPSRERTLVQAAFAAGKRPGMLLADAALAGHDLSGLEPHVLRLAAVEAAANEHHARTLALCARFFERQAADSPYYVEMLGLACEAAIRLGALDEARSILQRWEAGSPSSAELPAFRAIVQAEADLPGAIAMLSAAGAERGAAGVRAALIHARLLCEAGELDRAERTLRKAMPLAKGAQIDEFRIALHNLYIRRGTPIDCLQAIFSGHGERVRWRRFVPEEIVESGPVEPREAGRLASVILIVGGADPGVRFTVESILRQSHRSLNLLIVDDAAGPEVEKTITDLAAEDRRIRVIRNADPIGTAACRKLALGLAAGDYVAFCAPGDVWLQNYLSAQLRKLEADAELRAGMAMRIVADLDGSVPCDKFGNGEIRPSGLVIRAEVLKSLGDAVEFGPEWEQELGFRIRALWGGRALATDIRVLAVGKARTVPSGPGGSLWQDRVLEELRRGTLRVGPDAAQRPEVRKAEPMEMLEVQ